MKLIKVKCKDAGTRVYQVEWNGGYSRCEGGASCSIYQMIVEASSESNAKTAAMKEIEKRRGEFRSIELLPFGTLEQFKEKYPHSNYTKIKAN